MRQPEQQKKEMLCKVIAAYCNETYTNIDLSRTLKDNYIAEEYKINFCSHLCRIWKRTDSTGLYNGVFTTYKTGNDILPVLKS